MMTFLLAGPPWFLASPPPYESLHGLCAVVLRGHVEEEKGPLPVVFAFSDQDLAEQYLAKCGSFAKSYLPIAVRSQGRFADFLQELYAHGDRSLGIDAEASHTIVIPIADLLDQGRGGSEVGPEAIDGRRVEGDPSICWPDGSVAPWPADGGAAEVKE